MATSVHRPRSSSASRPSSRPVNSRVGQKPTGGRNSNLTNDGKRQIVGQYMLGKTIGEGTFGKVKLAVHIPSGEKVAIKILEKSRIKESADVRRVNREIKILKKARHGNVIQLYEVLDTPNAIYLIMECAEGGEMFDFIVAQKHVAEVQACKFFHQIVDGVESLHLNEITHRDLKPENLLLKASPDGWIVKVVDFGLSNTHDGGRLLATACGSPCYAAPEMIAGKKYIGPLADIWSMGVILFALVCGFLPFEDANTAVLYKKILSGDYKPPKWISSEVKDLIRRILEVDPKKRYTMADIRKHPWYQMVPESQIPREITNEREDEFIRSETLKVLANTGMDIQQLLDGLASHACNAYTATYYLFEQKQRAVRLKQLQQQQISYSLPNHHSSDNHLPASHTNPSHHYHPSQGNSNNNQARDSSQNNNNNNYGGDYHAPHRPKTNPVPVVQAPPLSTVTTTTTATYHSSEAGSHKVTTQSPVILPSTTAALSPKSQGVVNTNLAATVRLSTNIGPYLQTPQILQQARQSVQAPVTANSSHSPSSNKPENNNHISLDQYMKTGLTLPVGETSNGSNNHHHQNPAHGNVKMIITKPAGIPSPTRGGVDSNNNNASEVPKLSLKAVNNPAATQNRTLIIPPLQKLPVATTTNASNNEPLLSQTARLPVTNTNPSYVSELMNSMPLSARAALETTNPQVNFTVPNDPGVSVTAPQPVIIPPEFSSATSPSEIYDLEGKGRPSTRRSRMRSRNGADPVVEENMHEPLPAEGILEMDELPIQLADAPSVDQPDFNDKRKAVTNPMAPGAAKASAIRAPEGPRDSSGLGGRRGKNLVTSTATEAPSTEITNTSNHPPIQAVPPSNPRPSQFGGRGSNPPAGNPLLKPLRPSVLAAGVPPDSVAFSQNRSDAVRNKLAAQGSFKLN